MDHIIKTNHDCVPFLKEALPTTPIKGILFAWDGVVCSMNPDPC